MKVFFVLLFMVIVTAAGTSPAPSTVKAAYWPAWLNSTFPPSAIDTSYFTHLYYAFLQPDPATFGLLITESDDFWMDKFNSDLHNCKHSVGTILSIGGGASDHTLFANIAAYPSHRRDFIKSTIETGRKYGFDGLDLDWEYPADQKEMDDLGQLLEEWRVEIVKETWASGRRPLLLTAAVYYSVVNPLDGVTRVYPVGSISSNLDWINAMCFDYRGAWDTTATGAHAALFDPNSQISTSSGITSWLDAGVPSNKIVMGLPLFGHTWKLKDPHVNRIGAPAVDVGPGDEGTMSFAEIVDFNKENEASVVYDKATVSTYSYVGTSWISYDGPKSVRKKIKFARAHRLAGYFFWAVAGDKDWKISRQASKTWDD
ncbi:class V chitinase CHIT5-like [Aristolochia californica]|uniref:class V chitinase CHIT5-like n=1 Tax=Aristolochia californica TaxID=171875 RepID=UPI0035E39F93